MNTTKMNTTNNNDGGDLIEQSGSFNLLDLVAEIPVGCELGEGILWHPEYKSFFWTDIVGKKFYKLTWPDKKLEITHLSHSLCSFGRTSHPDYLICGFENGIALFNLVTAKIRWLQRVESSDPRVRLNDGRISPDGKFWVGSMVCSEGDNSSQSKGAKPFKGGQLYCFDGQGLLSSHKSGIQISNGICWPRDGADEKANQMFFADSGMGVLAILPYSADAKESKFETDEKGIWQNVEQIEVLEEAAEHISQRRSQIGKESLFKRFPQGESPDGAVTDVEGNIWIAVWGGSKIEVLNPNGKSIRRVSVPVPQPSCVAFGGDNMDVLAVTTARQDLTQSELDKAPGSGNVFIYQTDAKGILEPQWAGEVEAFLGEEKLAAELAAELAESL